MLTGTVVQTLVLFLIVYRTNWNKEVSFKVSLPPTYGTCFYNALMFGIWCKLQSSIAGERIREWGGETRDDKITDLIA